MQKPHQKMAKPTFKKNAKTTLKKQQKPNLKNGKNHIKHMTQTI